MAWKPCQREGQAGLGGRRENERRTIESPFGALSLRNYLGRRLVRCKTERTLLVTRPRQRVKRCAAAVEERKLENAYFKLRIHLTSLVASSGLT